MELMFVVIMMGVMALLSYVRLFSFSRDDAENMMLGDYAEYLKAWELPDTEEARSSFAAAYMK